MSTGCDNSDKCRNGAAVDFLALGIGEAVELHLSYFN